MTATVRPATSESRTYVDRTMLRVVEDIPSLLSVLVMVSVHTVPGCARRAGSRTKNRRYTLSLPATCRNAGVISGRCVIVATPVGVTVHMAAPLTSVALAVIGPPPAELLN